MAAVLNRRAGAVVATIGRQAPRLLRRVLTKALIPLLGIGVFLTLWSGVARTIDTSLGTFPGPAEVWQQAANLWDEHRAQRAKAQAFQARQAQRNAAIRAEDPDAPTKWREYTGQPTFFDQIFTSLYTVAVGFAIATVLAVPLGILCGLSEGLYSAVNPIIQVLKPISPLAWLPLVTLVVSAVYVSDDPWLDKSFLNSAFTVALCCLWPTVINTTVGVAGVDRNLVNVSRVLELPRLTHVRKVVLPSALPLIFTGARLSLATGWMVLIAAEMLAQNPGLGKFIWDEFQNGSSDSLGRIMVAVITIGLVGFVLDRAMLRLQRFVSWDKQAVLR
jgi:nitrate/nitrite transport system permease protein